MSNNFYFHEGFVCVACGKPGANAIGEGAYCLDCYSAAGSSCAGGAKPEPEQFVLQTLPAP